MRKSKAISSNWELDECLRQYYGADTSNPLRKNLEFFIPLRNKIEHRSMPQLDASIIGECQAMLLNFDEMLEQEFGTNYCIRESLSFSLQLYPSSESLIDAVKHNPATRPIDCVERHKSKWFEKGNFGWVLASPRRLNFRPCKGALRLFRAKY